MALKVWQQRTDSWEKRDVGKKERKKREEAKEKEKEREKGKGSEGSRERLSHCALW